MCGCQTSNEPPDPIISIKDFKRNVTGERVVCETILDNVSNGDLKELKVYVKVYAGNDELCKVNMSGPGNIYKQKTEKYKVSLKKDDLKKLSDNREINFSVRITGFYYGKDFRGYPFTFERSFFSTHSIMSSLVKTRNWIC